MTVIDRAGRVEGARFLRSFEPHLGAHPDGDGVLFRARVSADRRSSVRIVEPSGRVRVEAPMSRLDDGVREVRVRDSAPGDRYWIVVDGNPMPDPYARFLPEGAHGPALVHRPSFAYQHGLGVVRPLRDHVLYEAHVGAFTPEGTYAAMAEKLGELARLGITAIELMPLSTFPGARGWGYDGVAHFAPHPAYGTLEDLRRLVDEAHGHGLSVLLDVVYNHFGPDGAYLCAHRDDVFRRDKKTPWGDAFDYGQRTMRDYLIESALYWLFEVRFDGLRLDAVHAIVDEGEPHVLAELRARLTELEPKKLLIAEDDRNDPRTVSALGMDAVWADDFHHQVHVALTGETDGYYEAYDGQPASIARTIERGFYYEGQPSAVTGKPRGAPADELPASAFVYCLQNHDQVGNRALGERLGRLTHERALAAATALLLFLPMTPLLFMGEEWSASAPFRYFTDHAPELGALVSRGRRAEFASFRAFATPERLASIPDPQDERTFLSSKLDWSERTEPAHARALALHHALLALRRMDPVLAATGRDELRARAEGRVLVVERALAGTGSRTLVVSFDDLPSPWPALSAPRPTLRALLASAGLDPSGDEELGGYAFAIFAREG